MSNATFTKGGIGLGQNRRRSSRLVYPSLAVYIVSVHGVDLVLPSPLSPFLLLCEIPSRA